MECLIFASHFLVFVIIIAIWATVFVFSNHFLLLFLFLFIFNPFHVPGELYSTNKIGHLFFLFSFIYGNGSDVDQRDTFVESQTQFNPVNHSEIDAELLSAPNTKQTERNGSHSSVESNQSIYPWESSDENTKVTKFL